MKKIITAIFALFWIAPSLAGADTPSSSDYQSTMQEVIASLNQRDPERFNRTIDVDALMEKVFADLVLLDPKWKRDFQAGLKQAITTKLGNRMISQMPVHGYAKLLRLKPQGKTALALMRIDFGDTGNGYMDFHLKHDAKGAVRIVDWYDYSTGQRYSESLRQITASLSPTPTVLGSVFDIVSNRKKTLTALSELMQLQKQQRFAEVVEQFFELDEELRRNRLLNIIVVKASNLSQNMQLYEKALGNLERYYGKDPDMAFLLIDYYFMRERYPKVIATIKRLESSIGVNDAALIALKANAFLMQEKYGDAAKLAEQAVKLEPEYEHGYWSLLSARVGNGEYGPAVEAAKILQEQFSYDMSPSLLNDIVQDETFLESAEYKAWRGRL